MPRVPSLAGYFFDFRELETQWVFSEIDNDAYCVCTHDLSPCTHRNIRPVRTMYAVEISRYANSFRFNAYTDEKINTFKIATK